MFEIEKIKNRIKFNEIQNRKKDFFSRLILEYLEKQKKEKKQGSIQTKKFLFKNINLKKLHNIFLRFLLFFPDKKKITWNEYHQFSEDDKKLYLAYKTPRVIVRFFYLLLILAGFVWLRLEMSKPITYNPVELMSYNHIEWEKRADNEGFSNFAKEKTSFEWRIVIIPPNKSYIHKVQDISQINFQIRNLEGSIQVSPGIKIKEENVKYVIENNQKIIKSEDAREFTLIQNTHFASILGLNFISPNQGNTIVVNGHNFTIATMQLPQNSTIIKVGDSTKEGSVYKVNDHAYLFHNFSNPAIVYYQWGYHLAIQFFLVISSILIFILIFWLIKKAPLPSIRLKTKHFFIFFIALILFTLLLAAVFPNPRALILNWSSDNISTNDPDFVIANDTEVTNYLWWALAITRSIDAMIIGDGYCGGSRARHFYLTKFSAQKFIVLEEFKDSDCAKLANDLAPEKTVIIPQDKIVEKLAQLKKRNYFLDFFFITNAKILFNLCNLIILLAAAFLIWKAFSIKNLGDILRFFVWGFVFFFGLTFLFVWIGTVVHMPVGYHGVSNIGLIISNYGMRGIINGGNNVRTIFALLGCFVAILFFANVKKKINLAVYPFLILVVVLFLVIPKTEYFSKRFILTAISAEAYVWDYKIDAFNPFDFYKSIRDNDIINYLKNSLSQKTKAKSQIALADSLRSELRFRKSAAIYEKVISQFRGFREITSQAYFGLAETYYQQSQAKIENKVIEKEEMLLPRELYLKKAMLNYIQCLLTDPESTYAEQSLLRLAEIYQRNLKKPKKAIKIYWQFIKEYPESERVLDVKLDIAGVYNSMGDYDKALKIYNKIIKKYLDNEKIFTIKSLTASTYVAMEDYNKAIETYNEIIIECPKNKNILNAKFGMINVYIAQGNYDEALKKYDELLQEYTKSEFEIDIRFKIIDFHLGQENYDEAIGQYIKIIEKYPEKGVVLKTKLKIADTCQKMGNTDEAIKKYKEFIEEYPKSDLTVDVKLKLIDYYQELGDNKEVLKRSNEFVNEYPGSGRTPEILIKLAEFYSSEENYDQAKEKYLRFIENYPKNNALSAIKIKLGECYVILQENDQAREIYNQIIGNYTDILSLVKNAFQQLQHLTDDEEEKNTIINFIQGLAEESSGNFNKALEIYESCENRFKFDLYNDNAFFRIGEIYNQLGDKAELPNEKEEYFEKAREKYNQVNPNSHIVVFAKKRLEEIAGKINRFDNFRIFYDRGAGGEAFDNLKIISGQKEIFEAGSLRILVLPKENECRDNICDIGETPSTCSQDCKRNSNKIIINTKGQPANGEWPRMQVWIDNKLVKEWAVKSADYKDYILFHELTSGLHQIDIVYTNDYNNTLTNEDRNLFIDDIIINDKKIFLINAPPEYLNSQTKIPKKIIFEKEERGTKERNKIKIFTEKTINKIKTFTKREEVPKEVNPRSFTCLFYGAGASRGMTLYFAALVILSVILLLNRNFRTFVSLFVFYMFTRGLIRVVEQDPIRALRSIMPGLNTGIKMAILFIIISIIIYILIHPIRIQPRLKKALAVIIIIVKTRKSRARLKTLKLIIREIIKVFQIE